MVIKNLLNKYSEEEKKNREDLRFLFENNSIDKKEIIDNLGLFFKYKKLFKNTFFL